MNKNGLIILKGGQSTSIQDFGRFGHQDKGIPPSGVINKNNMKIANALVGNPSNTEVLEIFFSGPVIKINTKSVLIALVGGKNALIEILNTNQFVKPGRSIVLNKNDVIRIHIDKESIISTLAIAGGFKITPFLNSKSTSPNIGLGGLNGEYFKDNTLLPLNFDNIRKQFERILINTHPESSVKLFRVILGPHDERFSKEMIEKFLSIEWKVSSDINRMGIRLDGENILSKARKSLLSDGNQNGSIQITQNGKPIILLPDRGTTGGYPKIATIISPDFDQLSNIRVGQKISFRKINIQQAYKAIKIQNKKLLNLMSKIRII